MRSTGGEEAVVGMKDEGAEVMVETAQDEMGRRRKEMGSHKGEAQGHNSQ